VSKNTSKSKFDRVGLITAFSSPSVDHLVSDSAEPIGVITKHFFFPGIPSPFIYFLLLNIGYRYGFQSNLPALIAGCPI
jgi:hypothetical protein